MNGDALRQGLKAGMIRVWWQVKLCEPLYNTSYLSAVEAKLVQLSAIQIHVYFTVQICHDVKRTNSKCRFLVRMSWYRQTVPVRHTPGIRNAS